MARRPGRPRGTTVPIADRFWRFVTKGRVNECWLWEGSTSGDGHGRFWNGKQTVPAHHVAWLLKHKQKVPKGYYCRHVARCGEKTCMNPVHLYLVKIRSTKGKVKK